MLNKNNWGFAALGLSVLVFAGCQKEEISSESTTNNVSANGQTIPGKYIVVLKSDPQDLSLDAGPQIDYAGKQMRAREQNRDLLARYNVKDEQIYETYVAALRGFAVNMTEADALKLKDDPSVLSVEPDRVVKLSPTEAQASNAQVGALAQSTPWGITRVGGAGNGVGKVAWVVDSGVDLDHPDLTVNTTRSRSFLPNISSADDGNGHGTHVAGTIGAKNNSVGVIGVAAGATIISCRVLDDSGSGQFSYSISAFDYIAANGKSGDAVNYSVGPQGRYTSTALDNAVKNVAAKGIRFAMAAGNSSDDVLYYSPSRIRYTNVYVVSATDRNDAFASFSNFGATVTNAEPGVSIYSTYSNGRYATLSGTSMASPHAAGLLLLGSIRNGGSASNDPDGNADYIGIR